ncbi:MAG: hypothetical protein Q8O67_08675 [Deltaproteobacteria bacterium]|nr:hypothetical protein [Deltaproteobacteria bacterium]
MVDNDTDDSSESSETSDAKDAEPAGLRLTDVERALRSNDPNAPALLQRFLDEPDPTLKDPPAGTMRTTDLEQQLNQARRKRTKKARIKASTDVWRKFLTQKTPLPPRFTTADIVTDLYLNGGPSGRSMALRCVDEVSWKIGFFGAIKRIGKLAEDRLDAVAWAAVYGKVGSDYASPSGATRTYMKKRAWRFLRDLGRATPELYPWWAAEYLLRSGDSGSTAANRIASSFAAKSYAVPLALFESWKLKPEPLLLIVQGCGITYTVKQAWAALKKLHPDAAKEPAPSWVKTLIADDNDARHEIFVEIAKKSPTFAHAQLQSLGLFQPALRLLLSNAKEARAFAIELARANIKDIAPALLVDYAKRSGAKEVKELAKEILTAKKPRDLGPALLKNMLAVDTLKSFAEKSLLEAFSPTELGDALIVDLAYDDDAGGHELFLKLDKKHQLSAALWKRVLDDDRIENDYNLPDEGITALKKLKPEDIGADWLLDILVRRKDKLASEIGSWLGAAKAFPGLDIDRVKGLLFDRDLQEAALAILANKHLVNPKQLGIPWLLALAKRKDTTLQEFANRTLLESMGPAEFSEDGDKKKGEARLFEMALSSTEAELLRKFAQTFLRCHHPEIGEQQPEAKLIGLKPQLKREAYSIERMWPGLKDNREDVRKFAVTIAKVELRRWNAMGRLGEITDTDAVEVRRLALEAMLKAGDPASDPACTATVDELLPEVVFPLTESRRRPVREAGMELIRRHYKKLGGQERLAWLMTTADREVRLFAVRLLWEKHRPRSFPATWKPKTSVLDLSDRFSDDEALRWFLRRVMFALPPGRSMEAKEDGAFRRISSSVAKRRVVQIVRDLAVEDKGFTDLVRPLLQEMSASIADGEWQACLQALCAIDAAHGRVPPASSASSASAAE